jgi:hypothetical protein
MDSNIEDKHEEEHEDFQNKEKLEQPIELV